MNNGIKKSLREKIDYFSQIPVDIYLLKVNNRNTKTRCEICSKLTIKTPERRLASSKLKYRENLAYKLNDPKTAPKTYWKILKTFVKDSTDTSVVSR